MLFYVAAQSAAGPTPLESRAASRRGDLFDGAVSIGKSGNNFGLMQRLVC